MGQIPRLSLSTSTKFGDEPKYLIAFIEATYVKEGTNTS